MHDDNEAYERFMGRWSRRLAPMFVDFVALEEGDRVLDVGCGTGSLSAAVLQKHPSIEVIGIDQSLAYLDQAREQLGGERATFEEGDGRDLRFSGGSFDKVISLLVVNFIPDRDRAVREMMRMCRPGGVVAAGVWDYGEGMQMLRIFWDEAVALDPARDPKDERHMPLCRAGELAGLWKAHGMLEVQEVPLVVRQTFSSFEDYWEPFGGGQGPAGVYVAGLTDAQRNALEQRLRDRLRSQTLDGRITLEGRAWAVRGVVPRR